MRLAFDNEPRDATWAQPLETLVASVVKTTGKARLVSAECKTTVCKVVASHPPGRVAATWGQTLSRELGQAFPDKPYRGAFMYEQTLDMTVSTTYFTRNGFGEHHPDGSPRKKRQPAPSP
ncbi:MAG: hypothetical protein HYZ29_17860 [Myxococcales bacterium]|nr:hypothetical protein [Myxococcales bacterium]